MAGLLGGDPTSALDCGGASAILHGKLEEADHSSANWYFPREEIERNSPSLADGIDTKRETYFRKSYCTFLQDMGMRLKVPQVTIATAITFCHRFFLRQSHAANDRMMIATVCMFLAGKVEETPRTLKDVIIVSYTLKNKKDPMASSKIQQKKLYESQKELVLYGERLVLTTLGFDLNVHHPYRPLVAAIKKFRVAQQALAQVAWNFVNDGLRTSLCLQFKPHHIAAGAIFLAAKFLDVKLPNDGEKLWWQEFDVNPRQLEEVSNQMLELYEQNKAVPVSRGDHPEEVMNNHHHHHHHDEADVAPPGATTTTTANGYYATAKPEHDVFGTGSSSELRPQRPTMESDKRRNYANERPSSSEDYKDGESGSETAAAENRLHENKRKSKWGGKLDDEEGFQRGAGAAAAGMESKRYDGDYGRRDSSQDYRHHSEHHSGYYQPQTDRSRGSKDRDWPERESKKGRHK